jgi:hypothetical protein
MEWDFTPEDVVKCRAEYDLNDFRRDLAVEVRNNMAPPDEVRFAQSFNLIYDLCHWCATSRSLDDFLKSLRHDPPTSELVRAIHPHLQGNIDMLGAILQRMIMDQVEAGNPLELAVAAVGERHREMVGGAAGRASPH